jgi:hypothetical protein
MSEKPITAFKALDANFRCRGFQFEVGKTYTHDGDVEICSSGFHACQNPLDVLNYYDLTTARFAVVEQSGKTAKHGDDSKIASASITIAAELKLSEFVTRAVKWVIDNCKSGDDVQAASGDYAQLAASGDYAKLAASGDSAQLAASGDYAKLAASGHYAQLAASGDYAKLAASGHSAQLAVTGKDSVIASSSAEATASGANGTWISLAEFKNGKCVGFATGQIGKKGLKAGVAYRASRGKLVKA